MVTSTSTPGSMEIDVICTSTDAPSPSEENKETTLPNRPERNASFVRPPDYVCSLATLGTARDNVTALGPPSGELEVSGPPIEWGTQWYSAVVYRMELSSRGRATYGQYLLDDLRRGVQVDEALVHAHLESATLPSVSPC